MTDTNPPADRAAETRPRNQHCMNCGDNRGGPIGHETSECTYDSVTTPFRAALKPSFRLTLAYLIQDAQRDTHPLADAAGSTGPYIVHGCVVNSAQQLKDAVRAIWKHGPDLLDRLDRYKQANDELKAKFAAVRGDLDEIRGRYGDLVSDNNDLSTEKEQLSARVGELEEQLAKARAEFDVDGWTVRPCNGGEVLISSDAHPHGPSLLTTAETPMGAVLAFIADVHADTAGGVR